MAVPAPHLGAQHVAGRELDDPEFICDALGLRSLARSWCSQQNKFISASPQLGLLDEPFVLMSQQVRLDLRDRVHRHGDDDQQAGATEIEGNRKPGDQDLRQDADDRKVSRADHRQPGQHAVEILGGVTARPDAGDKAAVLLEVVRRLRRVEHDRRIEEGEEDDQADVKEQIERLAVSEIERTRWSANSAPARP